MGNRSFLPSLLGRSANGDDVFRSLHKEVDRVFHDFNRGFGWPMPTGGTLTSDIRLSPNVDVSESDDTIEVSAELPGVDEKDIEVTLAEGLLTIKGEKSADSEEKNKDFHLIERSYGSFQRSIRLPFDADPESVEARFDKGVLKVTLPKPPEVEPKTQKISVKPGS